MMRQQSLKKLSQLKGQTLNSKCNHDTIVVIGDDPATVNYGRTVLSCTKIRGVLQFRVLATHLVANRIQDIKGDTGRTIREYARLVRKSCRPHGADLYVAERYMTRGVKGTAIECISMMLAINCMHAARNSALYPAVTWKNAFKRRWDLDDLYKQIRPVPPHILDSMLLAVYGAHVHYGFKQFDTLTDATLLEVITDLERVWD